MVPLKFSVNELFRNLTGKEKRRAALMALAAPHAQLQTAFLSKAESGTDVIPETAANPLLVPVQAGGACELVYDNVFGDSSLDGSHPVTVETEVVQSGTTEIVTVVIKNVDGSIISDAYVEDFSTYSGLADYGSGAGGGGGGNEGNGGVGPQPPPPPPTAPGGNGGDSGGGGGGNDEYGC